MDRSMQTGIKPKLSHQVAKAGSLTVVGKLLGRGLDFVTLIVLSHVLTPGDFGLTALAMTSVTVAEGVTTLPLTSVLVREEEPTKAMLDTAFTLAFLRGCILAIFLSGIAFVMAQVYGEARLTPLVCALSLAPIFRGLQSPRMVQFVRKMDFRRDASLEFIGKAAALIVSTIMALSTHSYWSIAVATITTPLVMNFISYIYAPYRPALCLTEWSIFRSIVGWNSLTQLMISLSWQTDRLLLGYFIPKANLGRYTMANDLSGIGIQALVVPLNQPLLVAFSKRLDDAKETLAATYLKSTNAVLAMAGPLFVGLSLLSQPIVRLVLGEAWAETGMWLHWIAILNLFMLPFYHMSSLAIAVDQMRMTSRRTFCELLVQIPSIYFGSKYLGVPGALMGRAVMRIFSAFISLITVRELIGVSVKGQLMAIHRTVIALLAMGGVLLLTRDFVATSSTVMMALSLGVVAVVSSLSYYLCLYVLWSAEGRPDGCEKIAISRLLSFVSYLSSKCLKKRKLL